METTRNSQSRTATSPTAFTKEYYDDMTIRQYSRINYTVLTTSFRRSVWATYADDDHGFITTRSSTAHEIRARRSLKADSKGLLKLLFCSKSLTTHLRTTVVCRLAETRWYTQHEPTISVRTESWRSYRITSRE